jgi:hypothetical protein
LSIASKLLIVKPDIGVPFVLVQGPVAAGRYRSGERSRAACASEALWSPP